MHARREAAPRRAARLAGRGVLRAVQVLLVEDDPVTAEAYCRYLASPDVCMKVATTREEAIASAMRRRPDAMLVDMHLAGIGGVELLRTMKDSADLADIPVVVLSSDPAPGLQADCWRLGAAAYFVTSEDQRATVCGQLHGWLRAVAAASIREAEALR